MNALIKELAHTAASRTGVNLMAQDPKFVAALAELIVAECAELCSDLDGGENMFSRGIRRHFGIDE